MEGRIALPSVPVTVKKTLGRVFDKLGVKSRTAAALRAAKLLRKISHGL